MRGTFYGGTGSILGGLNYFFISPCFSVRSNNYEQCFFYHRIYWHSSTIFEYCCNRQFIIIYPSGIRCTAIEMKYWPEECNRLLKIELSWKSIIILNDEGIRQLQVKWQVAKLLSDLVHQYSYIVDVFRFASHCISYGSNNWSLVASKYVYQHLANPFNPDN